MIRYIAVLPPALNSLITAHNVLLELYQMVFEGPDIIKIVNAFSNIVLERGEVGWWEGAYITLLDVYYSVYCLPTSLVQTKRNLLPPGVH